VFSRSKCAVDLCPNIDEFESKGAEKGAEPQWLDASIGDDLLSDSRNTLGSVETIARQLARYNNRF
jgi:hypothetical protein